MATQKWYVVWEGKIPGIYTSWSECEKQVKGYSGAKFKGFGSENEANKAFQNGLNIVNQDSAALMNMSGITTGRISCTIPNYSNVPQHNNEDQIFVPPQLIEENDTFKSSISVDAACSGNPGVLEFRGVNTDSGDIIFHEGPFPIGTNNIGEFLALVTALQKLKQWNSDKPVYTDSVTAISWVNNKQIKTNLPRNASTESLWQLVDNKLDWLRKNTYRTKIIKWNTKKYGEIKADFGRK